MNMNLGLGNTLLAGDPRLVDHIVGEVKSQGIFDQFRKECIADVDTKPAYQNLRTRVESSVNSFLGKQTWKADLNKNQLRETLRKHINDAPYLDTGVERIVDQVVNPKVYSVFMPQIEDVVYKFLGLERPKNRRRNGPCGFKDLLPIDLDPVSPESDKNSLKDISLDSVDAKIEEPAETKSKDAETLPNVETNRGDEENEKNPSKNGDECEEPKSSENISPKQPSTPQQPGNSTLNNSSKSDDKNEEEEEDSPTFEPIDIMNLNDSQISNDSHLSGISELTSHRSRSPDFSNDGSRDNMDFSCHDSEFSKVSSDSRLSIVTDFGSSNHDSVQLSENQKDEKEKNDGKYSKDNFKAVREFESVKSSKSSETSIVKETIGGDGKNIRRSLSSKETSRDGMESNKEKIKENDTSKQKTTKERGIEKESKKDREKESSKKQTNNHNDGKSDKSSKQKSKDKFDLSRGNLEKSKDKDSSIKPKEEKIKDTEKKDVNSSKEVKDLKDIYKEKIRELREKKELLREKKKDSEKISKDNKDVKSVKDNREKSDSSREKKDNLKDNNKNSREKSSSRSDVKSSKISDKDGKNIKNESKDRKRDERKYSRDKSKNSSSQSDEKRNSKSEKDEKIDKSETKQKQLIKKDSSNKNSENKREIETKDKKRRDEKKAKAKDDHSSMRKNSDDRRSTDRDGSNGSNSKNSQKSNSSSSSTSTKPVTTNLSKESTNTSSNSSSETSDNVEESQSEKFRNSIDDKQSERDSLIRDAIESSTTHLDLTQGEISLPLKKRPLTGDDNTKIEITMKKPKFAKNFQEAKKLMKIRRKIEKEKIRQRLEMENNRKFDNIESRSNSPIEKSKKISNDIQSVPDDERVQIIEVCDEEYDEPYPEIRSDFTIEERSQIILGGAESMIFSNELNSVSRNKSTLSEMELSIRESLNEMINDNKIDENSQVPKNSKNSVEPETERRDNEKHRNDENSSCTKIVEDFKDKEFSIEKTLKTNDETKGNELTEIVAKIDEKETKVNVDDNFVQDKENDEIFCNSAKIEDTNEITKEIEDKVENFDNKLSQEIVKDKELKMEVAEIEEKFSSDIVKKEDKIVEPEIRHEIVKTPENFDLAKVEEKKISENVEEEKKIETVEDEEKYSSKFDEKTESPISEEKSVLKIVEKIEIAKTEENLRSEIENEEKTISEIVKKEKNIESSKTEEKINSEILKNEENIEELEKQENLDASRSDERSTLKITEERKNISSPKSDEELSPKKCKIPKFEEKFDSDISKKEENYNSQKSEKLVKEENIVESSISNDKTESCNNDEKSTKKCRKIENETICKSDDDEPCLYFTVNNDRLERFEKFIKSLEIDEISWNEEASEKFVETAAMSEEIVSSSLSKTMAPPKPKRKYSTSPLTDIMLNNTNNNNDADKITATISDVDDNNSNTVKKRKIGRPRKQKLNTNLCSQQNLSNGENFVMPLSPESDVSGSSEKIPSNSMKDEKSRPRGSNQRYTSDDLYKPRPLFASSSRRSRRSNPA